MRSSWVVVSGTLLVVVLVTWVAVLILAGTVATLRVPASLPGMSITEVEGLVVAEGTWTTEGGAEGSQQAFPLQTTHIECWLETRICRASTAELLFGNILSVSMEELPVREWTGSHIEFVDDSPACVRYIYTINTATRSVTGIRQRKHTARDAPLDCAQLDEEMRLTMRDGSKVWQDLKEKALPWYGRLALAPLSWF